MSASVTEQSVTLLQLNQLIARLVVTPATQGVWVTAELSDVAFRGGHCYMELLQKDEAGRQLAKARGIIWANVASVLTRRFESATGQRFASGIRLMVRASVSMHPVFGLSLVITDINPEFTMGDLVRRRAEILARLKAEGILEANRELPWSDIPLRIAVISAPGAAGYGDFINQIYSNPRRLRFSTRLFPAVMQGERTVSSVLQALDAIEEDAASYDGVVIIRGGGATSDLIAFDDYDLAARIACFSLPVIVGIGHERDVTVLDYVASLRVKTPTAAAEWLISRAGAALDRLRDLSSTIARLVTERIGGAREQLSYLHGVLPLTARDSLRRQASRLGAAITGVSGISSRRIAPRRARLDALAATLSAASAAVISRHSLRLDSRLQLIEALSPQATLNRGYSITRVDGRAVTSPDQIPEGAEIITTLRDGIITSVARKHK